jgi:hypothetical protein
MRQQTAPSRLALRVRTAAVNWTWGFIMRKEQFRALTDVYANTYATSRFQANSLSAGTPLLQDGQRTNDLRLEMLNGKYLLVEGPADPDLL